MFEPPFAMSTVLPAVLFVVFGGVGVVLGAVYHQQSKHGYLKKKDA
jgi:hypothetical protein